MSFHREYLVRLPLPLAQLYSRAHNAKDARGRHDNTFYLFEALVKLTVAPLAAAYLAEIARGGKRSAQLDRLLAQLSLPSLGQWTAMLRELSRHFGDPAYAATHPLGHLWQQLSAPRKDLPGALALYRRIKNGPDGQPGGDQSLSLIALLDSLVQYRNAVFGHGGPRFASFYEQEMGPLLFPAADELLAEETCQWWGPRGTRLVYLTELRGLDDRRFELGLKELIGLQAERSAPVEVPAAQATDMAPNRMGILWPGHSLPVPLDPLLVYRETELSEEVLFLNRELQGRQIQYLSYTTGRTERDKTMGDAMARLLSQITGREVSAAELERLQEQSVAETPSVEALFDEKAPSGRIVGDYEILTQIGRGGMGVVYLARQLSLGRIVALKMLPADLAGDDVALARFRREMRALARCDHPHIVKVLASGTLPDGQLYYAMEYVPGADLEHVWRELAKSNGQGNVSTLGGTTWASAVLSASRKQREQTTRVASGDSTDGAQAQEHTAKESSSSEAAPGVSDSSPLPQLTGSWKKNSAALAAAFLPPLPELPDAADDPGGYSKRVAVLIRDAALSLQAVHEQQIVHRDVKPANLMLTPDGQRVVLMDFGLAKGDSMSLTASRAGGFLGTLRYAAPEQLASATMSIGPSADIRGLGVVLWELLTRKRLFAEAQDERQLAQWIFDRDVPPLRSIDSTFDRDLEAIVARATERRVADRIHTASDLARYLQLYADGQPLPIRPPRLSELTRRWVREHKAIVRSAAAALAVMVLTLVFAFASINAAKNEAVQAKNDAVAAKNEAVAAKNQAEELAAEKSQLAESEKQARQHAEQLAKQNAELAEIERQSRERAEESEAQAVAARDQAEKQRNIALDSLNTLVVDVQQQMGGTPALRQIKQKILDTALKGLEQTAKVAAQTTPTSDMRADRLRAIAQEKAAEISFTLGDLTQASNLYSSAAQVRESLVKANPDNGVEEQDLALAYERIGAVSAVQNDLPNAKKHYQLFLDIMQRYAEKTPTDVGLQQNTAVGYERLGDVALRERDLAAAKKYQQQSLEIRQKLAAGDPKNTVYERSLTVSYEKLGNVVAEEGDVAAAKEYQQQSLEIRKRVAEANPDNLRAQRDLSVTQEILGDLDLQLGNTTAARDMYQQVLEIRQRLATADPTSAETQRDLSITFGKLAAMSAEGGDRVAAKKSYQQSLDLRQRVAKANPANSQAQSDLVHAALKLAEMSVDAGDMAAAKTYYQHVLEARQRLLKLSPTNTSVELNVSLAQERLAYVSAQLKDYPEAKKFYQQYMEITERQATADPADAGLQQNLSVGYEGMGDVSLAERDLPAAKNSFRRGLEIRQRLVKENPTVRNYERIVSVSLERLGNVSLEEKNLAEAKTYYQQCHEVRERLAKADPANALAQRDLALSYEKLGETNVQLDDLTAARDAYQQSLEVRQRVVADDPSNPRAQRDLSVSHERLGGVHMKLGNPAVAREAYQKYMEISDRLTKADPSNAQAPLDLALAKYRIGTSYQQEQKWQDAIQEYSAALEVINELKTSGRLPTSREALVGTIEGARQKCRDALADKTASTPQEKAK